MTEIQQQIVLLEEEQAKRLTPRALREILLGLYANAGINPETHPVMAFLAEMERRIDSLRKLQAEGGQ